MYLQCDSSTLDTYGLKGSKVAFVLSDEEQGLFLCLRVLRIWEDISLNCIKQQENIGSLKYNFSQLTERSIRHLWGVSQFSTSGPSFTFKIYSLQVFREGIEYDGFYGLLPHFRSGAMQVRKV